MPIFPTKAGLCRKGKKITEDQGSNPMDYTRRNKGGALKLSEFLIDILDGLQLCILCLFFLEKTVENPSGSVTSF
jgi:hypothetical protein